MIRNEIRRLNEIIEEFLGLSRGRQLKLESTDLVELVHQLRLLMEGRGKSRGCEDPDK